MLKREEIARIKEMYPKGTPIRQYRREAEELLTMWMTSGKSI